ncbi:uncharacterized protein LOC132713998 isoform X2 [Ruditapes philippinarum]|uniref:uncharacterized protein LOC132713998 isoform X2 n=1 Tax=Ruditapes philippinarum TaxID=129788 RepID=UPI00295A96FF|nr:uncharacterized protein LOC132713998 isoform X2 [Ruditapes philippinarum]
MYSNMKLHYVTFCVVYAYLGTVKFTDGRSLQDAGSCESEQGKCTRDIYENVRLRALKSSGCTKFCQCEHASTETDGSVTYKWAEHSCAPGLLFDEEIKVCNWPQQVQCQANVPEDCETELGQCTKFIYDVTRLRALKNSGCTKFCQCEHASTETDGSVTYKWAQHSCAPGLLFDEEIKVCNWPNNVQCNANDVDDCEKEHGECTAFVYENVRLRPLKSSGCTKFCQCEHASTEADGSVTYKWAEHTCPPGLLFDVKTSVCNWPQNVQCDGNGDNGGTDNGGTDNGGTDNGGTDNGGTDNGGTDNGGTDNGGTDNGGTDNGGTDNGGTDNGGTDNGGTDNGGTDNGGTDNGGTDNGGTDNGGTDNGGSDNGGTDNGGTDNGGTDNGGSNGDNGNNGDGGNGGNNDFECFKCYKSDSNEECNKNKEVCESDKETCQTRIEWKGDTYEVSKGCVNSDSSSSEDDSGTSSKETSSKNSSDESSDDSKEKSSKSSTEESSKGSNEKSSKSSKEGSSKSSKEKSSKSSKEKSSKSSKENSSKSSKEGSSKSSKDGSSKSSKEGSSKSSKEGSSKSSKEKSSKSSKEKSSKSSKENSSKSSKEKSTKSSKEKSTKSSKEKSSKSSKERSRRSNSDFSGCKKNGKKITCKYECTSSLCNEFLPPLYIE